MLPSKSAQQLGLICCATRSNATGLTEFSIAGNRIQGRIPDSMRYLRYLKLFDMQNTMMFCCGDGPPCTSPGDTACLPSFLQFERSMVRPSLHPRLQGESPSNMKWVACALNGLRCTLAALHLVS